MIQHWYLVWMITVTIPFYWYHTVTLTLTFDLSQGQICCRAGDHNSLNLLVDIKTHSSIRLSVTKTLTWFISSEVLMIEHWYLACMILVTSPLHWYYAVTLSLTFYLLQGQICCWAGDHNSSNLLVPTCTKIAIFSQLQGLLRCFGDLCGFNTTVLLRPYRDLEPRMWNLKS